MQKTFQITQELSLQKKLTMVNAYELRPLNWVKHENGECYQVLGLLVIPDRIKVALSDEFIDAGKFSRIT